MPKAYLQVVQDLLRVILALSAFIVIVPLIIYDAIYQTTFPNTEKSRIPIFRMKCLNFQVLKYISSNPCFFLIPGATKKREVFMT